MSASMYNNPYTYKAPPPRINYPPMFSGLFRITFRYILDAKFLALAALIQGVACLVTLITVINPFWFKLILSPTDGTFGSEPEMTKVTINAGLFYLDESEMDNAAFLNKFSNRDVLPKALIFAQVCSIIGTCLLTCCLCGTVILVFRRFGSLTGTVILAFFSSVAGVFLILVFILAMWACMMSNCEPDDSGCDYKSNLVWRMIPIYSQFYRVEPHITPFMEPNWGLFISIIAGLLACGGSVLVWIEAILMYRNVSRIRYQQIRRARDPHEKDVNVTDVRQQYVYQPPVQYGAGSYVMQPVLHSTGPYSDNVFVPPAAPYRPSVGFGPRFSDSESEPQGRPPSPGFEKRPLPSETSSVSAGPNISREINL